MILFKNMLIVLTPFIRSIRKGDVFCFISYPTEKLCARERHPIMWDLWISPNIQKSLMFFFTSSF